MQYKDILTSPDVVEPETISMMFPELVSLDRQKLQVMWLLYNTRAAYEDMDVFEKVVWVLNGIEPDVTKMEGSTPEFIWKSIDIIRKIHPNIEFADEVVKYIKYTFNSNGIWFYPERIGLDNPILKAVKTMAITGPFPLKESYIGIQTMHYLKIKEYLKDNQEGE